MANLNAPLSVISAKVKLALRCRSTLSENTKVLKARNGSPEKKSVSPRLKVVSIDLVRWGAFLHFRGTGEGLQLPLVRSPPRQVRTSHREICLLLLISVPSNS